VFDCQDQFRSLKTFSLNPLLTYLLTRAQSIHVTARLIQFVLEMALNVFISGIYIKYNMKANS